MKGVIYGLIDPATSELRYIGKSKYGLTRARQHAKIADALIISGFQSRQHVYRWLVKLQKTGARPEIIVIEEDHGNVQELNIAEVHFIAYFRSIGCRLTNMTDGGEGRTGPGKPHSNETKRKMSVSHSGKKASTETRAILRAAQGRQEVKAKISAVHLGAKRSDKARANMSTANIGKAKTDRFKKNMSAALRRPEVNVKLRGPKSETAKANMRAAWVIRKLKKASDNL